MERTPGKKGANPPVEEVDNSKKLAGIKVAPGETIYLDDAWELAREELADHIQDEDGALSPKYDMPHIERDELAW